MLYDEFFWMVEWEGDLEPVTVQSNKVQQVQKIDELLYGSLMIK